MQKKIVLCIIAMMLTMPVFAKKSENNGRAEFKMFYKAQHQKSAEHRHFLKEENKRFRKSLKGMPREQKEMAVYGHRERQYHDNKVFHQKMHEDNMVFIKGRLDRNDRLSREQKEDLVHFYDMQYKRHESFREKQHRKNMDFFNKIANNPKLTQEQKKIALKHYFEKQKRERQLHRVEQKEEGKIEEIK